MARVICVTNNPKVRDSFNAARFLEGTALDVFKEARDLVHKGWRFLAHPMYGNFSPSRQPYRTLILESSEHDTNSVDLESFEMIEKAMSLIAKPLAPCDVPEGMRHDFAAIDAELMKDTLQRYMPKRLEKDFENKEGGSS